LGTPFLDELASVAMVALGKNFRAHNAIHADHPELTVQFAPGGDEPLCFDETSTHY